MYRILHVYKKSYQAAKHKYLGSTKDIMSRKAYFKARNLHVDEVLAIDKTKYEKYLKKNKEINWQQYDAILLEMTFSPKAIQYIRKKAPRAKIVVRSHNAELLHRLHWAFAEGIKKNTIRYFIQALRYFCSDCKFGLYADAVLSIDEWEHQNYWPHISKKHNIYYVPFFLTEEYEKDLMSKQDKQNQCVNFTSSSMNPIIRDATNNFINLVSRLDGKAEKWNFLITGNLGDDKLKIPERAVQTGWLENPYTVLKESRAMALLSNLGFGFKTKILEAVIAKTYILMPSGLLKRMPGEITGHCISVDKNSPDSFVRALEKCARPYPGKDINEILKKKAFKTMDNVFLR